MAQPQLAQSTSPISHAPKELQRARALVLHYGWNAMTYQILNPGIDRWYTANQDSVVGYVPAAGYHVVAGAPVCAPEQLATVAQAFAASTHLKRRQVCYFGAQERLVQILAEAGPVATLLLGAQPTWNPQHWRNLFDQKASLRAQLSRARNKGVKVTLWPNERAHEHPALKQVLHRWLETRGLPPMHFLVEWNLLAHLLDRRVFVAERGRHVVGFLVASPIPLRNGWLIEQIIREDGAPNGTNELLLDTAFADLAARGAE